MFFPNDMTFQYFFFDTVPGYFAQVLPIGLIVGIFYFIRRWRRLRHPAWWRVTLASLFVCYITSLVLLTLFLQFVSAGYHLLFYQRMSMTGYRMFEFTYDLTPEFYQHFGWEELGNILLFVPFGLLYPFFRAGSRWLRTLLMGTITVAALELLQPVFGRAFDIDDVILNLCGVIASTAVYYLIHGLIALIRRKVRAHKRKKAET